MKQHLLRLIALTVLVCGFRTTAQENDETLATQCGSHWHKIRLVSQQFDVAVSADSAKLAATFELAAEGAAGPVLFAFPLWTVGGEETAAKVSRGEAELDPIPFWRLEKLTYPSRGGSRKQREEYTKKYKKHSRAQRANAHLNGLFGYSPNRNARDVLWQLHEMSFKAGETTSVTVELDLAPQPLADLAERGPCQAFRIPLRLGHIWASPAGKLQVAVKPADDVKTDDIYLVRPAQVQRDGSTLSLTLDGMIPSEDLVIVTKRKE